VSVSAFGGCQDGKASLGETLRALCRDNGASLDALTVLSSMNDPYRLDIPPNHINGKWFGDQMEACGLLDRSTPIHNRGIHYAIVSLGGVKRPDGKSYQNDEESWFFLQDKASKAARWLGYIPFEAISDARNTEPVIRIRESWSRPYPGIGVGGISLVVEALARLSLGCFEPFVHASFETPPQPYRLAIFGEKTSLQDVLGPISDRYNTDLYLPSGEISDTQIFKMAKVGAEDGREMIVFVLADCDPSGYQMATSIAHKLRALHDSQLPGLRFSLIAPCLTVEQVKDLGLPSTPLKATELRAGGWRERYGVEQTEIDALATLRPRVLGRIVEDAIKPYYDATLARRVNAARDQWHDEAREILNAAIEDSGFKEAREEAEASLEALRAQVREHSARLTAIVDGLRLSLPPARVPEPELDDPLAPLVSSEMALRDAIRVLKDRKDYGGANRG
jgi:hypothetical protein